MDTKDLVGLGIAEGLAALEAGRTSSEEWTAALLERMERLEPRLNSLTWRDPEDALRQARAADAAR